MLRIGQFSDTFLPVVDGVGRVALAYAETLCAMGHHVTVVAPMNDAGYRGDMPYELVDFRGLEVPGMKQYRTGKATLDAHYRRQIKDIPLDIIHSHTPFGTGSEALRLAARRNLPLVASFHSKYYDDFRKATHSEHLAQLGVKLIVDYYNRCDEVWAVGEATADVLRGYGFAGEIQVMPNGVTLHAPDAQAVAEVERRWALGDAPVVLFVGQMNWKKNILTVLEACAALRAEGVSFKLVLAGQGPDAGEIERKLDELGLAGQAVLTGHLTDARLLDGLYSRASIFAFPSLYDNAPMVVREAAVMGTPAVMVRGSSGAEIIRDGENGYLCENTPEDLARVIRAALENPQATARVGEAARESIPVPWARILETAVARYERLVALAQEGKLPKKKMRLL